jgi:hypothetical protein
MAGILPIIAKGFEMCVIFKEALHQCVNFLLTGFLFFPR